MIENNYDASIAAYKKMGTVEPFINLLISRKQVFIEYLRTKIQQQDWHGVADIAMDLRELEVEIRIEKEKK